MINTVKNTIARHSMLPRGGHVVVGLSGGADSVCLLSVLHELRGELGITLSALHVNHGIRGESAERDSRFCAELCERLGVELETVRVDVPALAARRGMGLEQCGRECRYEHFAAAARRKNAAVATAHTLSDSTETVLFNLTRGSALAGVCGIPPLRTIEDGTGDAVTVIRPLIGVTREMVEAYCAEQGLDYVTDETNADTAYRRNLIRAEAIPVLRQINPALHRAVERFCECAAQDSRLLEDMAQTALDRSAADPLSPAPTYRTAELAALPEPILRRCIMLIAAREGCTPEYGQVMLCRQCILEGSGAVMLTAGVRFCVRDGLTFTDSGAAPAPAKEPWQVPLTLPCTLLPDGRRLTLTPFPPQEQGCTQNLQKTLFKNLVSCDIIGRNAYVRNRREGDRFAPAGRNVTKQLKKLLQEADIPSEKRSSLAMIAGTDGIFWLEGFGTAHSARPRAGEPAFLVEISEIKLHNNEK